MFISNPFYRFSVHGGAACQSSREGSCPSAELRININFFIFSLNNQKTSKSAFLSNEQKSIESNSTACPASRTSGAFFTPNFTHCIHIEKPYMPLHAFIHSPAFVVFRGVFLCFSCFNQNTESRQNCSYSSTTEFKSISIEFYCFSPISAAFEGFLANFIHNYNLFLTPSRSNKKPAVAAVYSGNGVPVRSQNSHPQGWSRSELWETQSGPTPDRRSFAKHLTISKHETAAWYSGNGVPVISISLKHSEIWPTQEGSIPSPCSLSSGKPRVVISAKCEAMYAGKGAPETVVLKHVCGRRKLRGSSPRHSSKHRWMSCMHKKRLVMQSVYARLEGELRASAGMATRKDLLTAWNRHEVVLGEVVKALLFNAGFDSLHHLFCEIKKCKQK
jgi:hypothetical protein